ANGSYLEKRETFDGGNWTLTDQYTYSLDDHKNYIGETWWQCDGIDWYIFYQDSILISYNPDGAITQRIYQEWNDYSLSLQNSYRQDYFNFISCEQPSAVDEINSGNTILSIYPNPSKDYITVVIGNN